MNVDAKKKVKKEIEECSNIDILYYLSQKIFTQIFLIFEKIGVFCLTLNIQNEMKMAIRN